MRISIASIIISLLITCSLVSCKPSVPSEYIQPGQMEDILYDYHLAQGILLAEAKDNEINRQACKLAVLEKYGVSEGYFESSLQYYIRHTAQMHDIYEQLAKRFEVEAISQGATASDLAQYGAITAKGDTADVWIGEKSIVLAQQPPYNSLSFTLKADTAFHKGDRIMLNFDTHFIVQEGSRDGVAILAITFNNDSVASETRRIITNTHYSLQVNDNNRLGIKNVKGMFIFNKGFSNTSSTLKLMSVNNIQLIRMHVDSKDSIDGATGEKHDDGSQAKQNRDTLGPVYRDSAGNKSLPAHGGASAILGRQRSPRESVSPKQFHR